MRTIRFALAITAWLTLTSAHAQDKTIMLIVGRNVPTASYAVTNNQVVTFTAFDFNNTNPPAVSLVASNGLPLFFGGSTGNDPNGGVYTGLTNITMTAAGTNTAFLTFTVSTPTAQSLIPANAVVIPSDATGPVQIILESSSDLVNWTSSLPGTYGNTYSNRFFRVRAVAQ
ncbi:MAG TPA: hypothetical protein VF988_06345 [Verrucomicrobiae bacterium]